MNGMTGWLLAWNGAVFSWVMLFSVIFHSSPPCAFIEPVVSLSSTHSHSRYYGQKLLLCLISTGVKNKVSELTNVRSTPFVSHLCPVALSWEQKSAFLPVLLLLLAACCLPASNTATYHNGQHTHTHRQLPPAAKTISKHAAITSSPCRVCGPRCLLRSRCQVRQRQCLL